MEESWGLQDYSAGERPARSVDPVCGATVDETKAAGKIGYAGEMYYFCSTDCKQKFQENPGACIGQRQGV